MTLKLTLKLRFFVLGLENFKKIGAAQGDSGRPGTRVNASRTRVRLRLKIALVFDPVLGSFWDGFGSQNWSKIDEKWVSKLILFLIDFWT